MSATDGESNNYSMIYQGKVVPDLATIYVGNVNDQLQRHVPGRSLLYLQWALANAGEYKGAVTGDWNAATQAALDRVRGAQYDDGHGTYAPITGDSVSRAFLAAFFEDWLDAPLRKTVA